MSSSHDLEEYLHIQIPLSAAMFVSVVSASAESVILSAPLEPNINHKHTVFGGSASALGILAAWSLVHLRLGLEGVSCEIVIQSNRMDYDRPITGRFSAQSSLVDAAAWPMFVKTLKRKGRGRVEVQSTLAFDGLAAGRLTGKFVALLNEGRD